MKSEWCCIKNAFDPDICDYILELGQSLPVQDSTLGVSGENSGTDYRKSKIRFIQNFDSDFAFLFDSVLKTVYHANDAWFDFHLSKMDYIQLAEYDESYQGEYKEHHDVFWMNNDPKYHRKLTAVIQLTVPTEYEGGDLEFCNIISPPNPSDIRSKGSIIIFPSFIPHRVTPVTKGTRHSLACWIDGPKWR